jgi:hypothetical protein
MEAMESPSRTEFPTRAGAPVAAALRGDTVARRYKPTEWPRLMSPSMACAYLGDISAECFARCVATRIRAVRWPGQSLLYDRADLDRWLDEGAPQGAPKSDVDWLAELEK